MIGRPQQAILLCVNKAKNVKEHEYSLLCYYVKNKKLYW